MPPASARYPSLSAFLAHTTEAYHIDRLPADEVRAALLRWYDANRRRLPWRGDPPPYNGSTAGINTVHRAATAGKAAAAAASTAAPASTGTTVDLGRTPVEPYGVWVSEIMLQQTRVEAVIPYWCAWMEAFPTVEALAAASEEQVNARWAGLGFYRRARMLHEGSQQVVREHGGKLPETVEGLMRLRGIGRYTAGAIASVCFGVPAPIVDGNVLRVLSRLCGVACSPKDGPFASDSGLAWRLAERLVCAGGGERPGDLNQAIMELGATLCAPGGSGVDPRDPLRAYYASTAIGRDVYAALTAGELARLLEPTTAPNETPATAPVTAAHGLFACPVCRHGAGTVLSRLQSLAAQPLPAAAPAVTANPFAIAADPRGLASAARAAAAIGTLPAALADAEAGAALVHSWLPLPAAKKAKREERLAVAAIYHDRAARPAGGCAAEGEGRRWLLVRRPEGGLLGGQWEFPHAIVASAPDELPDDPGEMFRRAAVDAVLEGAGVSPAALSPRAPLLRTLEHIFSHVRHTIHVEHACMLEPLLPVGAAALASDEPFESGGRTYCWMHAQRMAAVGVTSGVQKVLGAVDESLRGEGAGSSAALKQKPKKDANGPTAGAGGAGQGKRKGGGGVADEKTQPKMSKFFSKS